MISALIKISAKSALSIFIFIFLISSAFAQLPGQIDNTFNSLDRGFGAGDGAMKLLGHELRAVALQSDGKVLIGGMFSHFNSKVRNNIVRLNANGTNDTTFHSGTGTDGPVYAIAVQSNGKILVGGDFYSYNSTTQNGLIRLNSDGTLDLSFTSPGQYFSGVRSILLQPDGKILVGGNFISVNNTTKHGVARLLADGTLDTSFTPPIIFASFFQVNSLALQPDGKLIVGGHNYKLRRLNSDGSTDLSFNPGTAANDDINAIALQSDGKVVVGGEFTSFNGISRNKIARLTSSGNIDPLFNPGSIPNYSVTEIHSIVVQSNDNILLAGVSNITGANPNQQNIARLLTDGSLDPDFDAGSGFTGSSGYGGIKAITLQPDGKAVIVGGYIEVNGISRRSAARINTDGSLDGSFNTITGANSTVRTVSVLPDGSNIVGGDFTFFDDTKQSTIKLTNNGTLDIGFNLGAIGTNKIYSTTLQPDGKTIIAGQFNTYNGSTAGAGRVTRINANGTRDTGFNSGGAGANYLSNLAALTVNATALQADGKILIGGVFNSYNGVSRNNIARLNANGTLDGTFSPGGGPAGPYGQAVNSIAIQEDGKIVIGGSFTVYNSVGRGRVARINSNGTVDTGFNGQASNDGTSGQDLSVVNKVIIQPDGKILIFGEFAKYNGVDRKNLARLNSNGTLDTSFDPGIGPNDKIYTAVLLANGKIIIGGDFTTYNGIPRNRIACINADGSLDLNVMNGSGLDSTLYAIALQPNGDIILGGDFTEYNGTGRNRIARVYGEVNSIFNNSIGGAAPICTGLIPQPLIGSYPLGGFGNYSYTWLESTLSDSSGFSIAGGNNSGKDYSPGVLNQTTWFRRIITSQNFTDTSAAVVIYVNPIISNNIISSNQVVSAGQVPVPLSGQMPVGASGAYTYQWQQRTASTSFVNAIGNSSQAGYGPGVITQPTWYRRIVNSGLCSSVSNEVVVTFSQTSLQIGSGAGTNTVYPINTCNNYNYTQQIYTATELAAGGTFGTQQITKLRFNYLSGGSTTSNWNNWTIYLGNTAQSSFSTTSSWVPFADLTQVYSGTFTPVSGTWVEFNLPTPFIWDGISNLVVAVDENSPNTSCTAYWKSYTVSDFTGIQFGSSIINPDPVSPPIASSRSGTKAQIQFEMSYDGGCTGAPVLPDISSSVTSVCKEINFTVSLPYQIVGAGISYQWQTSSDEITWSNIGTNASSLQTSIVTATYFRLIVTCNTSGLSTISNSVLVNIIPYLDCYCTSAATGTSGGEIFSFSLGSINTSSSCSTTGGPGSSQNLYSNYRDVIAPADLVKGQTLPFSMDFGGCGQVYQHTIAIYIDLNQNGLLSDLGELVYVTPTPIYSAQFSVHTISDSFVIPYSALPGLTLMRVINTNGLLGNLSPCGNYSTGETEDYLVNILASPDLSVPQFQSNSFCQNSSLIIPFHTSVTFNPGNIFTAQLSDSTGSFANPLILGTIAAIVSDTISAGLPSSLLPASGYRIRVVASNPAYTSLDNGADLTVSGLPTVSLNSVTQVLCNGGANGSATASVSGGSGPFSYNWSNGVQNATVTGLSAGSYSITVMSAGGCSDTATITISEPSAITASISALTNVACNGGANGSATVTAAGGTGAYTYMWLPSGGTAATASGLAAGNYTVTITDANGCTGTASGTISQPANAISASITAQTNVSCNGGANGAATVSATGGTGAFTYSWNTTPVQTTSSASGLTAGTYSVTIADANGCTDTETVTITEPANVISASITAQTNISCNGASNGSATVAAVGGTAPYSYVWNTMPVQSTATASGLVAGTYIVTVTDANGCTATVSVQISQPSALVASVASFSNVSCNGGSNGTATATTTGGTGAVTYTWNTTPVQTMATATGLPAGTYVVTVSDANGCTDTESVIISEPSAISASITASTNISCNGGSDGSATASAAGGTGTVAYSWNTTPVQTTPTATGLAVGTYFVTVTDANGCTDTEAVTVTGPAAVAASITASTNVSCFGGSDGSATVSATGGTGTFTYSWNTSPVVTTATATGLAAGTYVVIIIDANGCTDTESVTISEPAGAIFASITAQTNVSCNGGSNGAATVSAIGGTGAYTYSWSGSAGNIATASNLSAGSYTVTVTDANGCTATAVANITEPAAVAGTTVVTGVSCNGGLNGSINLTATGGTGSYTYNWGGGVTTEDRSGLGAGIYTVAITDANGCTGTASATITEPSAIAATVSASSNVSCNGGSNGSATVAASGGTGSYTYLWSPLGGTSVMSTGLPAGSYTVTVTDANGCAETAIATISQPAALVASIASSTNVSCKGGSDGTATSSVTGGTGAVSYIWNTTPVQTTITATGLEAGTYTLTATDANGCEAIEFITITEPASAVSAAISAQTDVSCNGLADGSATVTGTGGTGAFTYAWSPSGGAAATATGLVAGTYTAFVTDDNGCTDTAIATINQPSAVTVTISGNQSVCLGDSVTLTATGADTYVWSPINLSGTAIIISPAITTQYTLTGTTNGCPDTAVVTITVNQIPVAVALSNSPVSTGDTIQLSATGGVGYTWSGPDNFSSIDQNPQIINATPSNSGNYTVVVVSADGCISVDTVNVSVGLVSAPQGSQARLAAKQYPNPFQQEFYVELPSIKGTVEIRITDMMGRLVYNSNADATSGFITVKPQVQLPQGVYLLQLKKDDTNLQFTIIKQ